MPERASALRLLTPIAAGALFTALWWLQREFWLDDAFITFRYSRNLAEGVGPFFNPGEAVEGYTNFLWMLLCALPFAVLSTTGALTAIKLLGLGLGWLTIWRGWSFPGPAGAAPGRPLVWLLAISPVFVANHSDGMETPLFTWLLVEAARATVGPVDRRSGWIAGAAVAGLALTRPDGLSYLVALPVALLLGGGVRGAWRGWLTGFATTSLPPIALHLLWRKITYGAWLPNTFHAKATGALGPRLEDGPREPRALAHRALPDLSLRAVDLHRVRGDRDGPRPHRPARRWLAVLWLAIGARVAFDLWSGSETMGILRFLAPALPSSRCSPTRASEASAASLPTHRHGGHRRGGRRRGPRQPARSRLPAPLCERPRAGTRGARTLARRAAPPRTPGSPSATPAPSPSTAASR